MALRAKATVDNTGMILSGSGTFSDDETLEKDTGETLALAPFTILAKKQSSAKLVVLEDINPALTSASLECAVNGGVVGAYQAADAEFAITINGILTNVQVDMTGITALTDIAPAINTILIPLGAICTYNEETNTFYFASLKKGLPSSTISALTAVVAGAGTDISGATQLNGLAAAAITLTAATGEVSTSIPYGIFWGSSVTAASLVAADVTNRKVLIAGDRYLLDEDDIVLRGSLALTSIVAETGKTISQHLRELGILFRDVSVNSQVAPI